VKFGLRAGMFHTCGNAPGNRASCGIARCDGGNGDFSPGLARPAAARATMSVSQSCVAAQSSRPTSAA